MSKKIILSLMLLVITLPIFSQSSAGRFSLKNIDTYWESNIPISSYWIPKFKPFGNSTTFTDSTNYVTLNKGLYAFDSIKTDKDLIVSGAVVLDTNRLGKLYYVGNQMYLTNGKTSSASITQIVGFGYSYFEWQKSRSLGNDVLLMTLDTINGLTLNGYNVQTSSTSQIKLPSDTASDYTGSDAIVINRQSGTVTTKTLSTATDDFYTFTLTNSLISATSKVFLSYAGGTESAGRPMVYRVVSGSGSATCIVLNLAGAGSFNGNIKFNFVVFN